MIYTNGHCLRHCRSHAPCIYIVFISFFPNIAQKYLHSIYNLAVTLTLTPVMKRDEK